MHWLPDTPRTLVQFTLATVCLAGCPSGPSADDGEETDGTDDGLEDPQACIDPGSPLLDDAKPAELPNETSPDFTCGSGWATDAPQLNPSWTIEVPTGASSEFGFAPLQIDAHPGGGVVTAGGGVFARYDADGGELWNLPNAITPQAQVTLVVEDAGTIVLSTFDWSTEAGGVDRYDADGNLVEAIAIPWNADLGEVWALDTNADELIVGAFDLDAQGSYEATLLRLDAANNVLLRKSTGMTNSGQLAVNASGSVAFGAFPTFVVTLDNGAVLGNLAPSSGGLLDVAGSSDGFVMTGSAVGDFSVGRYSEAGAEQWIQTYDRAALGDIGRAIAAGPDGSIVAVGSTSLLAFANVYWFGTQPWIVGVDADGNATWSDRIAAVGEANGVAFGSGGEVYVSGLAEGLTESRDEAPPLLAWVRRYDP